MIRGRGVREQDGRAIWRLIAECCALGADPAAWQSHLILGLRRIFGFQIGTAGMLDLPLGRMTFPAIRGAIDLGWSSPKHRTHCLEFWASDGFRDDPLYAEQSRLKGPVVTRRWQDLVDSRTWYRSEPLNRYYRVAEQGHLMSCSISPPPESGLRTMFINVLRPERDRPFSERDRDILHGAMRQVRELIGIKLMPFGFSQPPGVTPRMRQVMALLLRGCVEKEVASELGLSLHTVHEYVKDMHRTLGVCSRKELLSTIQSLISLPPPAPPRFPAGRRADVLAMLLEGRTEQQIAREMNLSSHTIHDYTKETYRRFAVHNRASLCFKIRMSTGNKTEQEGVSR